jgi:hypothetical protein
LHNILFFLVARSKALVCGRSPAHMVGSNPAGGMDVCLCECCVLSGRGLCYELITRPQESYRLWCVVVCDLETSKLRRPCPTGGLRAKNKIIFIKFCKKRCLLIFVMKCGVCILRLCSSDLNNQNSNRCLKSRCLQSLLQ